MDKLTPFFGCISVLTVAEMPRAANGAHRIASTARSLIIRQASLHPTARLDLEAVKLGGRGTDG